MLVRHCQRASFSPFWVLRTAASFSPRRFINTRYFRTQSGLIGTLDPESTSTMAASEVAFLKRLREDLISRSDHSRGVRNEGVDEEEQQQLDDQSSAAALSLFEGNFEEDPENAETLQNVFIEALEPVQQLGEKLRQDQGKFFTQLDKHWLKRRVQRKRQYDAYNRLAVRREAKRLARGHPREKERKWPKRDLLFNKDLKLKLEWIPQEHKDILQRELDIAALGIGHNPSWSLAEKRAFMLGLKKDVEYAARVAHEQSLNLFERRPSRKLEEPELKPFEPLPI